MAKGIDRREFIIAGGLTAGLTATARSPWASSLTDLKVTDLKVDYLTQPLGLENPHPRLSWRLESRRRGIRQRAYRVLVASSEDLLRAGRGDLWDSGQVRSRTSIGIPYQGLKLESRQRCWGNVQVGDERDEVGATSMPACWEMGLLNPKDWIAQWLEVEDAVSRADRQKGLRWIWGASSPWEQSSRKFRLTFDLPETMTAGELIAVTNVWWFFTQIT